MSKLFIPSSWHLMQQIKAAEAKFDAAREQALRDRAYEAQAINARKIRDERAASCRRHVYVGNTK